MMEGKKARWEGRWPVMEMRGDWLFCLWGDVILHLLTNPSLKTSKTPTVVQSSVDDQGPVFGKPIAAPRKILVGLHRLPKFLLVPAGS